MEPSCIEENARERERLRWLTEGLSDAQLSARLGTDWTVAVALAHLAFWDQRSLVLIRKWKQSGVVEPVPVNIEVLNDALLPLWLALPPREASRLALECAEAVDGELAQTDADLIAEMERIEGKSRVYRSIHRKMHLDEIEALLNRGGRA
jgi:hypothetical protein